MGVDIDRGKLIRQPSNATVFWAVLGFVTLGTALTLWVGRPEIVPPMFGTPGGITVLALSLIAHVVTATSRRTRRQIRIAAGLSTLILGVALEALTLQHIASGPGPADTGLGVLLSAGVLAMIAVALRAFRGRPA